MAIPDVRLFQTSAFLTVILGILKNYMLEFWWRFITRSTCYFLTDIKRKENWITQRVFSWFEIYWEREKKKFCEIF